MKLFTLYRIFMILATPFIMVFLFIRYLKGKEDKNRFHERLGFKLPPRPAGHLIWMHGASVGECLSMQPLIQKLLKEDPELRIMVTSGTITSAALMAKRLPERAFHVYIPVDFNGATRRFVRHFHPDAVFWFESEFWPNVLSQIYQENIPLILLNGRISDRSFDRWQKHLWIIRSIMNLFTLIFGQSPEDVRRLQVLGAKDAIYVGNIKCAAPPAPFNQQDLDLLLAQIGNRPCWVGGSTHPDEESQMADIHLALKNEFPDLLTISAPRHPERRDEIRATFEQKGLKVATRSQGEQIDSSTDVYLSDTLGEMGLIYQLAPIVFVGGSLIPFGGQNMLEPMRLGRVVMIGPHAFNFRLIVSTAKEKNALIEVQDKQELAEKIRYYLTNSVERNLISERAELLAKSEMSVLDRIYESLKEKELI